MRISRGRFHLRLVLLLVGGGFIAWRAWETRQAALSRSGADRVLGERLALVMVLVAFLAILTAMALAWQTRRRDRRHSLQLGAIRSPGPGPPPSGDP